MLLSLLLLHVVDLIVVDAFVIVILVHYVVIIAVVVIVVVIFVAAVAVGDEIALTKWCCFGRPDPQYCRCVRVENLPHQRIHTIISSPFRLQPEPTTAPEPQEDTNVSCYCKLCGLWCRDANVARKHFGDKHPAAMVTCGASFDGQSHLES